MIQIRGVPEEHRRIHKWVLVAISMWEKVPTPKSNSQTPAGSPTIQLDSDTIYPDEASDSTGKRFNPMWLPHPGQSQVQLVTCASDPTGYKSDSNHPLLRFQQFAGVAHRTQRNNLFTRLLIYYRKDRTQELPDGNDVRGKVWRKAPGLRALSRTDTNSASPCVHQSGHSLNQVLWGFLGGFITICLWWSIHPPAPLPNFGGWVLKVLTL